MLVVAGIVVGMGLAVVLVFNRQVPTHGDYPLTVPTLAVIEAQPMPFRIEARGYGVARPAETWLAIANVSGRVVERHPALESGNLLRANTVLLTLDPSRYELAIAAAEAELAGLVADRAQLDADAENTRLLIELERERLGLMDQELSRIEALAADEVISQSQLDEWHRATITQRGAVVALENQIRLVPSRRNHLDAQMDRAATLLEHARKDLDDTRFVAPYDLRLRKIEVEMHQHVGVGQLLFEADNIESAEVEAQIPISMLRRLMAAVPQSERRGDAIDIGEWLDFSAIDAEVFLVGVENVEWPARVDRVASGLDPGTRTVRIVVVVDEPYRDAEPPLRPVLQRDMYVQVRLSTESPEPLMVVPATAVHQGEVYLVGKEDRLERRPVDVAFEQRDLAVIRSGLSPGDLVIVDDPVPALNGMQVAPHPDDERALLLRRIAEGKTP